MKTRLFACLLALGVSFSSLPLQAAATESSFAVIFHPHREDAGDPFLREALNGTDDQNLSFVVAQGVKSASEPCTDALYERRKSLLDSSKNGVIVSLAGSDWAECKTANGKSAAIGRLARMRELFFTDEFSLGSNKIPVTRQSTIVKFRSYGENMRWEFDDVMFATLNLPRNNNHYSPEAGRNGEFDDRQIANKDWLQRVFSYATRKKMDGIVIFCDGNPLPGNRRPDGEKDGFLEIRKAITALSAKFAGRVLLVHGRVKNNAQDASIQWKENLGTLESRLPWVKVNINPDQPHLFALASGTSEAKSHSHGSSGR